MKHWIKINKPYLHNKKFLKAVGGAFLFLLIGIVITNFAIIYATNSSSGPVTDIILDNIRTYDVGAMFIYGPLVYWIIIGLYLLNRIYKLPFALKSIALFLVIRSAFIVMTHIGPSLEHLVLGQSALLRFCCSGDDLFFSSHTGTPFLMALVFWNYKKLRIFSLIASVVFGAVVLMAHLHYSIDVFAAFFITYAIFHIAEKFFKKDKQLFTHGLDALT